MPSASQKSIQNAKGKFLQAGEEVKFGGDGNAALFSGRAAAEKKGDLAVLHGTLKVVDAPQAAVDKAAKAAAKVKAAKEKDKAAKAKGKKAAAAK